MKKIELSLILVLIWVGGFLCGIGVGASIEEGSQPHTDYYIELRPSGYVEIQTDLGEVFTINADSLEEFIEKDNL